VWRCCRRAYLRDPAAEADPEVVKNQMAICLHKLRAGCQQFSFSSPPARAGVHCAATVGKQVMVCPRRRGRNSMAVRAALWRWSRRTLSACGVHAWCTCGSQMRSYTACRALTAAIRASHDQAALASRTSACRKPPAGRAVLPPSSTMMRDARGWGASAFLPSLPCPPSHPGGLAMASPLPTARMGKHACDHSVLCTS
jgi:hypothetical protein